MQLQSRAAFAITTKKRPHKLEADYNQKEKYPNDLSAAPAREPMFYPNENRPRQQNIEQRKKADRWRSPQRKPRSSRENAGKNSQQPTQSQRGCDIQRPINQPHQKICGISKGKAQQARQVEILVKRAGHNWE